MPDLPVSSPAPADRRALLTLAAYSFLLLFAEVAFIRWLGTETRFFAYYQNLALISCFLGIGAGAAQGGAGTGRRWFVPALLVFALFLMLNQRWLITLRPGTGDEFAWMPQSDHPGTLLFYAAFMLIFGLNACVFAAGGQAMGAAFEGLAPLRAYSVNLLGSLAGVLTFGLLSYLRCGPLAWFGVIIAVGLAVTLRDPPVRLATSVLGVALLGILALVDQGRIWSPYYQIVTRALTTPEGNAWGYELRTNGSYILSALDLSEPFLRANPGAAGSLSPAYYNLPYRFFHPRRVLVLGAGAGNDVAAALRHGAESVTAVEIDPEILRLGYQLHPEKPYDSPRVRVVLDDARAFLEQTEEKFDLVVFGLVDSKTVVASMSNVRLDNFLYTREALTRAQALLNPGGAVSLAFSSGWTDSHWILYRLASVLQRTFGQRPLILDVGYDNGVVFLAGPGVPARVEDPQDRERLRRAEQKLAQGAGPQAALDLSDDWPFMYLKGRYVPREYWVLGACIVALAALLISRVIPGGLRTVDAHLFLLGAGFLLLEVRNLAELALLFGSTWVVNTFVIAGVLLMALLANLAAERFPIAQQVAFLLLAVAIAVGFLSPTHLLAGADRWVKILVGTSLLSLPFFFSGLVFSSSFRSARSLPIAYGSNLLGAVVGGLVEHASLALGIQSLSAFALVIYALAYLTLRRSPATA